MGLAEKACLVSRGLLRQLCSSGQKLGGQHRPRGFVKGQESSSSPVGQGQRLPPLCSWARSRFVCKNLYDQVSEATQYLVPPPSSERSSLWSEAEV